MITRWRYIAHLLEWAAVMLVAAAAIDLVGVWIWLSFIHDGPEFPY